METFRCPTCVGVLPDAYAKRCGTCGQGLRRKSPRVLGEEHRLAGTQLPVDRWMLERLYGEHRRKRTRVAPVAWHGRFVPSSASADPDLQRPPVMAPPAPNPIAPSPRLMGEEIEARPVAGPEAFIDEMVEEQTPATVNALSLDMFVAPASPEAPLTPRPIVTHEALDPEVRALVDELYEQARAEVSGADVSFDEPEPESALEMRLPTGEPVIDVHFVAEDQRRITDQ